MSRGIEIKFKSAEAVGLATRQIDRYTKGVQERIRGVIRKGAVAIYDTAVRMAPSGPTGNLKKGISFRSDNDWKGAEIVSNAPHSHLVEFGTEARITYPDPRKGPKHAIRMPNGRFVKGDIYTGKLKEHPFMRPAYMKERDKIESAMKEAVERDTD